MSGGDADDPLIDASAPMADQELLTDMLELVPAEMPPPALRARIIEAIAGGGRLHRFAAQIAELLTVPETTSRSLLDALDEPKSWSRSPVPGLSTFDLAGEVERPGTRVSFLKLEAGCSFPEHEHLGPETVLLLQGWCTDGDGVVARPATLLEMAEGTSHRFDVAPATPPLLFLAINEGGIRIGDFVLEP